MYGIYLNNNPIIIPNEVGEKIISSVLCSNDDKLVVGKSSKESNIIFHYL